MLATFRGAGHGDDLASKRREHLRQRYSYRGMSATSVSSEPQETSGYPHRAEKESLSGTLDRSAAARASGSSHRRAAETSRPSADRISRAARRPLAYAPWTVW